VVAIFVEKTMDPVTTAIVAALPALGSDPIKSSVKHAYAALKAIIRRRWGDTSPVAKSVDALEANPKSKGQAEFLAEHVAAVNAEGDAEVVQVLAKLIDQLKKGGIGGAAIAQIAVNISGGEVHDIIGAQNISIPSAYLGGQCSPIVGELPAGHAKISL
jgi:hypothetical protein